MADTCASCGGPTGSSSARWCGRCGARLGDGSPRRDARSAAAGPGPSHALVGAGTTAVLIDDDESAGEVAPVDRAWSRPARAAAAVGVLVVLVGALLARPQPEARHEPRGFTARGDASRSGVVSLAPLDPPTRVAWTAEVGSARTGSSVRSAGDLVLEQTAGGVLVVRDATTGEVRWLRRDSGSAGGAVRVGDVVVVPHERGLRGFASVDGAERWALPDVGTAAVLVPSAGDVLALSSGRLLAVDAATGAVRWALDAPMALDATIQQVATGGAGLGLWLTSPPGLPVDSARVTHRAGVLDPATGELRADTALRRSFRRSPIAVGDRHVATADVDGVTITTPDGGVVHRLPDLAVDELAATGNLLAVATAPDGVHGFDLRTGRRRWTRPDLSRPVAPRLVAADGFVFTGGGGAVIAGESGRTASTQPRLDLRSVAGETDITVLPAVSGTELELRDRRGAAVRRVPLVPDEAAAPAVGANRVFVPTPDGVEALTVEDGTRDWTFAQLPTSPGARGGQATARTPAVASDTVVVSPGPGVGRSPGLVALQLGGGVRTWDRHADAPIVRGPLTLVGETVFVPVGAEIHAYEAATGRRSFAAVAGTTRGPLVVSPNRVIGGPAARDRPPGATEAVAILRRDRSENWRTPLSPCSGPVLAGERVAWGTSTGLTALDERTGAPAWELTTPGPVCLDPVAARGRVAVVTDPGTLLAVPAAGGGAPLWATELPAPAVASPVLAGGHLLVPLLDGTLAAYDLEDGTPVWTFELGGVPDASPTVLDGHVLVHLRDGRLLALAP